MKLRFGSGQACRRGRRHYRKTIDRVKRSGRRDTKLAIRNGTEPPVALSVIYTD